MSDCRLSLGKHLSSGFARDCLASSCVDACNGGRVIGHSCPVCHVLKSSTRLFAVNFSTPPKLPNPVAAESSQLRPKHGSLRGVAHFWRTWWRYLSHATHRLQGSCPDLATKPHQLRLTSRLSQLSYASSCEGFCPTATWGSHRQRRTRPEPVGIRYGGP